MTVLHVDQQRLDELTEWCRNKPEEAAHRILHAEAEAEVHKGDMRREEPKFEVVHTTVFHDGPPDYKFRCKADSKYDAWTVTQIFMASGFINVRGLPCRILDVNTGNRFFTVRSDA